MDPSNLKSGLPMSPHTEEPLISLHFPQKLWRIINECTSGAISWSVDGKVVVIDYANFQSTYMYEQQEIFKTSNMRSFIRQLNLYGFRKGRRLPSPDRQRVTRRVSKKPPSPSSRPSTQSASDSTDAGPSHLPPNNRASSTNEGVPWYDDNSSSCTSTDTNSLSDYDWEHITAMAKVLSEKSLLDELTNPDVTNWPVDETVEDMSLGALQPVCPISGASSTECGSSPMPSSSSSMLALLDTNNSPNMVLTHQAGGGEPDDIPWLEESLMLDSVFGNLDESLSDNLYSILTEEAENRAIDDQPSVTIDGVGESATSFFTSSDLSLDLLHSVLYDEDRASENDEFNLASVQEAPQHSVERTPDA
ncbi:uncharacterized protein LOC115324044 [Ixodes scapularis]|uniref:uncharacterized protein LOC115324044 n=1 Tax=Ixodes scapularis TaxID=6945 RepID=UPI001A9DF334|nr:uncharacterized protein LOC115324044 [Ixodes scapularis]